MNKRESGWYRVLEFQMEFPSIRRYFADDDVWIDSNCDGDMIEVDDSFYAHIYPERVMTPSGELVYHKAEHDLISDDRDSFEKFYKEHMLIEGDKDAVINATIASYKPERDKYGYSDIQEMWVAWKASRDTAMRNPTDRALAAVERYKNPDSWNVNEHDPLYNTQQEG